MAKIFAYAWASGLIEFGTEYPQVRYRFMPVKMRHCAMQ